MAQHRISRGLDLPVTGAPAPRIDEARRVGSVAVLGADSVGMRPRLQAEVGSRVRRGQLLFEDRRSPGVRYTAPGAGEVVAIHRGERRAFVSLVIRLDEEEEQVPLESFTGRAPATLAREDVQALLVESGLWTALRTRPFSHVPAPDTSPHALFVNAMDTSPLAPAMDAVYAGNDEAFRAGMAALRKLVSGRVYLCRAAGAAMAATGVDGVQVEEFVGPHPAGTVGLHIHCLDPVYRGKTVWHVGLQDVIAIGRLFSTGTLDPTRVVSLAGPQVREPRLLRTRLGAGIDELVSGELRDGENRVLSGSILTGRVATGDAGGYLGRYHQQISVLREGRERELLGWLRPGSRWYSVIPAYLSSLFPSRKFSLTTSTMGSRRAMVPIGLYERVMPLDLMPTFLLRALLSEDLERAEALGVLELDEEDLALCSFVCPGKQDYGMLLRRTLDMLGEEA